MKTQNKNNYAVIENESEQSTRLTVYFFCSTTVFGKLVQVLQWLLGAPWNSPTHVAIGYKGKLIQLFTDGINVEEDTGAAYRLCSNVYTIRLDDEESVMLLSIVAAFKHLGIYFSLTSSVTWCWRVLTHSKRNCFEYDDELSYGEIMNVTNGKKAFFSPPISCTTFVWQAIANRLPITWRVFAPAYLEQALDNLQE